MAEIDEVRKNHNRDFITAGIVVNWSDLLRQNTLVSGARTGGDLRPKHRHEALMPERIAVQQAEGYGQLSSW